MSVCTVRDSNAMAYSGHVLSTDAGELDDEFLVAELHTVEPLNGRFGHIRISIFTESVAFGQPRGGVFDQIEGFQDAEAHQQFFDLKAQGIVTRPVG